MPKSDPIVNLPGIKPYKIDNGQPIHVYAHCTLKPQCPHCGNEKQLRKKAKINRTVHHEAIGKRNRGCCTRSLKS